MESPAPEADALSIRPTGRWRTFLLSTDPGAGRFRLQRQPALITWRRGGAVWIEIPRAISLICLISLISLIRLIRLVRLINLN